MQAIRKSLSLFLVGMLVLSMALSFGAAEQQATAATTATTADSAKAFSWNNATVYFAMTDRFNDGDSSNNNSYGRVSTDATGKNIGTFQGGDIKGLTQKLQAGYFTDLGINAIWITAPYEQVHGWVGGGDGGDFAHYAYHGYYALDYTEMDKNVGTVEEFRTFVDLAHSLGIRVVVDVVMNHEGYATLQDMEQYGFGSKTVSSSWTPGSGETWHSYTQSVDYTNASGWASWWGSWVRAGIGGYTACGGDDKTQCLSGLPDLRTDLTGSVGLAPILKTKWAQETSGYANWIVPAASGLRQDLNIAPADYVVKWLSAWVQEFGIDGFRVDTAKHVELSRWSQLKTAANAALQTWRQNNPSKPGADWTDSFWMTAEVWGHGVGKSEYYSNGFDSVINFAFQTANFDSLESIYSSYASAINASPRTFNALSYISSHDTSLYNRGSLIKAGTALLLVPGAAQIFYGDETARPAGPSSSDSTQATRSFMNWSSINTSVLSHWQKLGQFRNNHLAVGAGVHKQISASPYTFSRVYTENGADDKVVAVIGASGSTAVNVSSVFDDDATVRDAYTGNTTIVSNGYATFAADANGVILIEQTAASNLPALSAAPAGGAFKTDTQTVALSVTKADSGKYTLDGSDPAASGISFVSGDTVTLGADMAFNESKTLKLYASNENGAAAREYTFTKKDPNAKLTIHFKKPSSWSSPQLYYYETSPTVTEPTWAAAPAMTQESGDWYSYAIAGVDSVRVMFKDSSGHQTPGSGAAGFLATADGWYSDQWYDHNPEAADTEAPTAPTNVTATSELATTAKLSWTASTDNVGVTGYVIYRDGVEVGSATTTSYTDSGLTANTTYSYTVKAKDAAGNLSAASAAATVKSSSVTTNSATIYYKRGYSTPYFHYSPTGGTWTTSPGKAMTASTDYPGYSVITVDLGTATSMQAVFNNGSGTWDNNGGKNYTFQQGTWTYDGGTITAGTPPVPDTTAPSAPTNVAAASASASTATVSWQASIDNVGVTGYVIYRDGTKVGTSTATTYADSGLAANTTYSYTVKATDAAGNLSDASAAATVKTPEAVTNSATIYYKRGYSTPYFHYAPTGGAWTTSPGKAMTAVAGSSYSVITVDLGTATSMQAVFNNGSGTWDNNGGKNYTFQQGTWTYDGGTITAGAPAGAIVDTTAPSAPTNVTASAKTSGSVSLSWTASTDNVGVTGYEIYRGDVKVGTSTTTTYTDSGLSASTEYRYAVKAYDAAGNVSTASSTLAVTTDAPAASNAATIYYKRGYSTPYFHYAPTGGAWTTAPGKAMTASADYSGYSVITVDLGTATSMQAVFNNGSGTWDNNGGKNYTFQQGTWTYDGGTITAGAPASALVDTTAPSAPTNVAAASISSSTATVSWLSSTDNVGVTGYVIYRDGTKVGTSTTTTYADSGLAANTTYSYTVKATDAAGNLSDASAAATVTTAAGNSATIYYKRGYSTPYFHYAPTGGTWTTSPGKAMTASADYSGYSVITVDLGTATSMQAVFNNGSGTWDNNGGKNYTFQQGTWTYDSGTITAGVPGTDTNSNDGDDEPITGTVEWSKQSIYFIMTDRFVDGDTSNDNYGGFNSDKSNPSKWHGGDFQGIIDNLDYIKNMGFTAIWITPVTMQNSVYAYHGYHTYDFYSVDGHLGTMDKFKELVSTAHNKGIAVMLDVVVNHTCDCSTGNVAAPFNQYDWYHHRGTISDSDYNNNNTDMIENGEVAGLDDLNQENPAVEQALNNWIQWLIGESKVDGLRVDTAKHVPKWYLKSFDTAANTFTIGEVFHGDPAVVGDYSNYLDAVLDFPMYYTITDVFAKDGSMYNIQSRYASDSKYRDTRYNGLFIDNHDTKRFLNVATSSDKWKQLKAALGFILTSRGIPIVYQGTELGCSGGDDPANREDVVPNANHELYKYIAAVNAVRNKHEALQNGTQKEKWVDTYVYGFQRSKDGDEAVVLINNAWTSQTRTISNLDNMSGVGTLYNQLGTDSYSVSNGSITVTLAPKEVKILTKS